MARLSCPECGNPLEAEPIGGFTCLKCQLSWTDDEIVPAREERPRSPKPWIKPNLKPLTQLPMFEDESNA